MSAVDTLSDASNSLTIADSVAGHLVDAIVKGEISPGSKLNEPNLSRQYNISRGPLREAIRRLEGLSLVERIPHVGARVVSLSKDKLLEIYDVREVLEGMACRLAARNMEDEQIQGLWELLAKHEEFSKQVGGRAYFQQEGDLDIHYRIIKGSQNSKLISLLCDELYHLVRLYRYRSSQSKDRPERALVEHRHIIETIENRDEELAEILMRRHIQAARKAIVQVSINEQ